MGYDSKKQYVNKDDYFEFSGIDLDVELKDSMTDNPTKKAEIFIRKTTRWMWHHISTHFNVNQDDDVWDDDVFKEAILYQLDFIHDHGDVKKLCDEAYNVLHNAAMINPSREPRYYRTWL